MYLSNIMITFVLLAELESASVVLCVATSLPPLIATPPTIHRWKEQFNLFKTLKQLQQQQYWRCQCSTAPAAASSPDLNQ